MPSNCSWKEYFWQCFTWLELKELIVKENGTPLCSIDWWLRPSLGKMEIQVQVPAASESVIWDEKNPLF